MAATKENISEWFDNGVFVGATHMIIVCDEFNWEDFPVYVGPIEDVHKLVRKYQEMDLHRVMEVYNLSQDKQSQLDEHRAFHYD